MSADKLKQIEKSLAEQESFVKSIIQQRERKSKAENNANIDNILSSSIQKVKQKITIIDSKSQPPKQDRSFQNLSTSRQKRQKSGQQGTAIAAAMKKLQERISNLQKQNSRLEAQNKQLKKHELGQAQKTESMRRSMQQNVRKIKNLQSSILNDKNWIKQLQRKNQNLQKQLTSRKINNNSQQLEKKISTSQMMFRAQEQDMKNLIHENQIKQRKFLELQNRRKQEEIRYSEQLRITSNLCRQLQLKISTIQQKNKQKDLLIESLKNQIRHMDSQKHMKSSTVVYNSKVDQLEIEDPQKNMLQSRASRKKNIQADLKTISQLQELREKYQQLFLTYKNLDQKSRQQKLQTKNYRNKFWQLKESVKQLVDKIQTLPNGVTAQLKYLIVKINKIEAFSNDYFAATPTKSVRKNSMMNSSSRSKSNSKRKQIKLDLNRSNNSAKSKRSSNTNRSTQSKKSAKSKQKQKQVIVSQKTIKKSEIAELQAQIQEIRKKYRQLVQSQNKGNEEVNEDIRDQLNNLAVLLQEKSETLTKLKRKK